MKLVISMMTRSEISQENKEKISNFFIKEMNSKSETYEFIEDDFFEFDVDLVKVNFSKATIHEDIMKVIKICESILIDVQEDIDFIIANDDTDTEVKTYVDDWNNIKNFGLFITKRKIVGIEPYYGSDICNAYLNFEYVSFGCMF